MERPGLVVCTPRGTKPRETGPLADGDGETERGHRPGDKCIPEQPSAQHAEHRGGGGGRAGMERGPLRSVAGRVPPKGGGLADPGLAFATGHNSGMEVNTVNTNHESCGARKKLFATAKREH